MIPAHANRQLPRLLLIDDDQISLEVLSMMLEMEGYAVETAESGEQALMLLDRTACAGATSPAVVSPEFAMPEVVLVDTQMPGLSGLELVDALRQRAAALAMPTLRIVAISGSDPGEAMRLATDGFLLKPFAAQDLTVLLASAQTADSSAPISSEAVDPALRDPAPTALGLTDPIDPIDPEVLRKLRAMMPAAAVAEIYAAVASDMTTRLVALTAAMDAGNAVEVVRIAHMIKGGCGMVGLSLATQAAARLETSNLREAWPKELLQLHFALSDLQRILGSGLP